MQLRYRPTNHHKPFRIFERFLACSKDFEITLWKHSVIFVVIEGFLNWLKEVETPRMVMDLLLLPSTSHPNLQQPRETAMC